MHADPTAFIICQFKFGLEMREGLQRLRPIDAESSNVRKRIAASADSANVCALRVDCLDVAPALQLPAE